MDNRRIYLLLIIGSLIQLFFYLGTNNSVFAAIGACILFGTTFIFRPIEVISIFAFLLSNQRIIVLNQGGASLLNLVVFVLILRFLSERNYHLDKSFVLNTILILAYSAFLIFIHEDASVLIISFKFLLTASLFYFITKHMMNEKFVDLKRIIRFYIFGAVCTGVLGIVFEGVYLGAERFSAGEYNNSNILGTSFSYAIALLTVMYNRKLESFKFFLGLVLPLLFFGLLTQSRSFLLAIAILAVYLMLRNTNIKGVLMFVISILSVFILQSVLKLKFLSIAFDSALLRVLEPRNDDISGGRTELWIGYLNRIYSETEILLFGKGLELTHEKYGFSQVAHNLIIETIAAMGIIGLLLYLSLYYRFYSSLRNIFFWKKIPIELYIPLLILISNNMTGHSFINMGFSFQFTLWIILLAICLLSSKYKKSVVVNHK